MSNVRTRIKFCGITRLQDARLAAELGVDALGFVFCTASPRYVDPAVAATIAGHLPPLVSRVALFLDPDAERVKSVIQLFRPDYLQFHGRESPEFCSGFGVPYLKTLGMAEPSAAQQQALAHAGAAAFLLDSHRPGEAGGTGRNFDWSKTPNLSKPVVLAGGLTPANVAMAIRSVQPFAVDVSSGIEQAPGVKDPVAMGAFVAAVQSADAGAQRRPATAVH